MIEMQEIFTKTEILPIIYMLGVCIIMIILLYILWLLEAVKRKKAEWYIYIEKDGHMTEYENFVKWY